MDAFDELLRELEDNDSDDTHTNSSSITPASTPPKSPISMNRNRLSHSKGPNKNLELKPRK